MANFKEHNGRTRVRFLDIVSLREQRPVSQADDSDPNSAEDRVPFADLINRARAGERDAMGKLVDSCRDYLLLIANQDIDPDIRRKVGPSDIVQESLLTAQGKFDQFRGSTQEQLRAWLRQILVNDLRETRRNYKGVQKRAIANEQEPAGSLSLGGLTPDPHHTPSTDAALNEQAELLQAAIKQLPEDYQRVLRMRNWEHMTYEQIGLKLNRSPEAIRKIWGRAVLKLQELLPDQFSAPHSEQQADEESP